MNLLYKIFVFKLLLFFSLATGHVHALLPQKDMNLLVAQKVDLSQPNATLRNKLTSESAKTYLKWAYLTDPKSKPSLTELRHFVDNHSDWPRISFIKQRLERDLVTDAAANSVMDYLRENEPVTIEGKIRYVSYLLNNTDANKAQSYAKMIWQNEMMSIGQQKSFIASYGTMLNENDYYNRMQMLLGRHYIKNTDAFASQLSQAARGELKLRTKLIRLKRGADKDFYNASQRLKNNINVQRDLVHFYRKTDQDMKAINTIISAPKPVTESQAVLWYSHRNVMSRVAFKQKRPDLAYKVLDGHGLKQGGKFVDAEWYQGWLSLRHLNKPQQAQKHFQNARSKSSMPISVARGEYWLGRAKEQAGDNQTAKQYYQNAAKYFYTYYGQLGLVALNVNKIDLPDEPMITQKTRSDYRNLPFVQAAYAAMALDQRADAKSLLLHLTRNLQENKDFLPLLTETAQSLNLAEVGVKVAKAATTQGLFLRSAGYPLTQYFINKGSSAKRPLFMSLTRQESEYDQFAKSFAGARGLMQLMPATAKSVSRKIGERYTLRRLTYDPGYNVALGVTYIEGLLNRFNGSYVKSLAGYNAGPSRIPQWIETYGAPRQDLYALIDWVETIPFGETRNYVQRIIEALQVYRAQQDNSNIMLVNIENDLLRGL
ncbi:MAG: lytic transglycosylase domain-containing protein [Pseudomonadota bacterium]